MNRAGARAVTMVVAGLLSACNMAAPGGGAGGDGAAAPADLASAIRSVAVPAGSTVVSAKVKGKGGVTSYEIEMVDAGGIVTEVPLVPGGAGSRTSWQAGGAAVPSGKPDPELAAAASVARVTIEQAMEIAVKQAGGTVTQAKLSSSKGLATWVVEVRSTFGAETKVKLDAGTGAVVL